MPNIIVTPLSAVTATIHARRPSHLVTLLSPEQMIETPDDFPVERHLRLGVQDVAESWAAESPPTAVHVQQLLNFAEEWRGEAPMLVHCWAGISRSMAAAYSILCHKAGPGRELDIAWLIRSRAPHADPNRLIVRIADDMLARQGRMVGAIETIGRGTIALEGVPVELPLDPGTR
jgi:predicted protein tyrosine phosphatase